MNEELFRLLMALIAGILLGIEREYQNKFAGIRTITLISVGSALFTMLSIHIGAPENPDRIASNILTGIGFIGAGVIFKNDINLNGLTTAATIWVAAAMGMAMGSGHFVLGFATLAIALTALIFLKLIQNKLNSLHQVRVYKFSFQVDKLQLSELEAEFRDHGISFRKLKEFRSVNNSICVYELSGRVAILEKLNEKLMSQNLIDSFNY
ncbi:MAG: MgtC/SapB family protein [Chitinophagaceae bacterium]